MANPCPDFNLAPLKPFDPSLLLGGRNTADAFVLVLAVAFNDLKDANWTMRQLDKCRPDDIEIVDAKVGQWQGMRVQFTRQAIAILHELLEAIQSAHHVGLLQQPSFEQAVRRCSPRTRAAWSDLVAAATNHHQRGKSDLRKYLHEIRNRAAFHYDRT